MSKETTIRKKRDLFEFFYDNNTISEVNMTKLFSQKKWLIPLFSILLSLLFFPMEASSITHKAKKDIEKHFKEAPWLGLIANEIHYGPLKISDVHLHKGSKLVVVAPGETIKGSLKYRIDSEDLSMFHAYHLIVGLKDHAQDCVTHTLALGESKGTGHFKLTAPQHPGAYEVRINLIDELTCSAAFEAWNSGRETPTASATIGCIIVE